MSVFQLGHVGINVTDLERSAAFYRQIFGLQVVKQHLDGDRSYAYLGLGDGVVLTLWQQSTGEFAGDRPGLHHLAWQVDDVDAVRSAEERVRAAGARLFHDGVVPHAEGAASGGIFFADPDGTRIEIFTPTGADSGAAPSGEAPTCGFF